LEIQFTAADPATVPCDLLAIGAGPDFATTLAALDARMGGHLLPALKDDGFDGKAGSNVLLPTYGQLEARRLLVLGLGDGGFRRKRAAAGTAGRTARKHGAKHLVVALGTLSPAETSLAVESLAAGNYTYDRFKKEDDRKAPVDQLTVVGQGTAAIAKAATARAKWQTWARDLVNGPPEEVYPASLAEAALELRKLPGVEVEVWDLERCKREGCVGIEAVGRGSDRPGHLIKVRYRPAGAKAHVALVGKGVTFDSGGLSLKPSASMQTMRCDMAGAASVLAATATAAELGAPVAIDTFVAAVENLTGGRAYKLGDVLRYPNGVTVEIHNTDAEGRLVLADALIQASKVDGVTHIVDLATLTGAIVVALGPDYTGLFTDDDALANGLLGQSDQTGEGLWRMPLHQPYKKSLSADWAVLKNVGSRDGGAITAALFLQHFVGEGKKWAHLDIAGPAFLEKDAGPYAAGATGEPVRTLTRWLESL